MACRIPKVYPQGDNGPEITVIAGRSHGVESEVKTLGGCWYLDINLKQKGSSVFQELRKSVIFKPGVI